MRRREPAGELAFFEACSPVALTSADAGHASKNRVLAGACVLDQSCGLARPFVLHQSGNTIQLSAVDIAGQGAQIVVSFQLPGSSDALLQASCIVDGPMIVIQHDYQSLLVGFRGIVEGSLRHPSSAQVFVTAQELRAEAGGWQIHELQLPGQCMRRSLLWAGQDSKQAVSGSAQPLVCILLGCRCGAIEAKGHALLELQYSPQAGWRAEELAQSAAVRPTAICQVPPAASAALEACIAAPAPQLAVVTAAGELLVFGIPSGQQQPQSLLRALPAILEAQKKVAVDSIEGEDGDKRVRKLLRGSLAERLQWPAADAAQQREPSAAFKLLARARLPSAAHQLAFVPDGRAGQLVAVCADRERTMCCLNWPLLQQGPRLMGVSTVAVDPSGLGIFIDGEPSSLNVVFVCD